MNQLCHLDENGLIELSLYKITGADASRFINR